VELPEDFCIGMDGEGGEGGGGTTVWAANAAGVEIAAA